ncbi:helix-turn-helix domain-containing protein [Anaerovibrio lipolyticus]|uniref:helix-turn-helix domain-containing protein n=1 Tax=Anaerovibrio lipolyticus TaxID=82374 RepID=UPI003AFA0C51
MIMKEINYGRINIKLDSILQTQNISINKLAFRAELQRSQVRGYCKNTIQRLDTAVLARLCYALDCDITDLIEYIPPEND